MYKGSVEALHRSQHPWGSGQSNRPELVSSEPQLVTHAEVEREVDCALRRPGFFGLIDDLKTLVRSFRGS